MSLKVQLFQEGNEYNFVRFTKSNEFISYFYITGVFFYYTEKFGLIATLLVFTCE